MSMAMLLDRPLPPTPRRQPPAGVYDRAREALAERGHIRGTYVDRIGGRVCLMAALAVGCGAQTDADILAQVFSPTVEMTGAMIGLAETIRPTPELHDEDFAMRYAHSAICNFNNTPGSDPDALLQRAAERYA